LIKLTVFLCFSMTAHQTTKCPSWEPVERKVWLIYYYQNLKLKSIFPSRYWAKFPGKTRIKNMAGSKIHSLLFPEYVRPNISTTIIGPLNFAQWNPIRNLSLEIDSIKSKMTKSRIDWNRANRILKIFWVRDVFT
jgi:hypothetical protein